MGRRAGRRWVTYPPNNSYFSDTKPAEESIVLTMAEFEALRLKHYINLNQQDAAKKMVISQPTFSRVLERAHQKLTQALIEGKSIKVYGGNYSFRKAFLGYGCLDCNHEWEDKHASKEKKVDCPKCQSDNVYYLVKEII
ncbi:MAG: DUF134 domain-containing protein [Candidatus Lokiarchaeota archaeon]|nr:DUF134 domain-containing protein [Candidatus Lokiarchaeota archaeon]